MPKTVNLPKIRIVPQGNRDYRVFVDDIDVSNWVTRIEFAIDADEWAEVKLTVVGYMEMPENLQAIVTATEMSLEELVES